MALAESWFTTLLCVIILTIVIRWLINYSILISRLPPGPWGLPIFGYIFWLSELSHLDFIKIGKKYGGMFSIGLGTQQYVVLNDWPSVKATLVDQTKIFSGREQNIISIAFSNGKDLAFTDGAIWRKQRNTVVLGMKAVGMSKKSVEGHLATMIEVLIDKLNNCTGKGICLEPVVTEFYGQSNWKLFSNFAVSDDEDEIKKFSEDVFTFIEGIGVNNLVALLPWLRFVPPNGFGHWKFLKSVQNIDKQIRKLINKHNTEKIPADESIIAYHLHKFRSISNASAPYNVDFLVGGLFNLYSAAYGTMISTTLLSFYYLCQHPEIQEKIHKELDIIVGRDRMPRISDFEHLQQLELFILETHRIGSIVPLSVPHKALQTVEINGYTLPKGTVCFQNIYAIHHDPNLWDEPEEFKPQRFLNQENKIQTPPFFMPFSIGPRLCLGQTFAEMELRLLFASLLQQFTFSFPKDQPRPPLIMLNGVSTKPAPFPVVITVRQ